MNIIENDFKSVETITSEYRNHIDYLKGIAKEIFGIMENKLNEFCKEERIVSENSVYPELYPFGITYRVKSDVSLREKVLRASLLSQITIDNKNEIMKRIYANLDDIIGITILLDTNRYLAEFANMIKSNRFENIELTKEGETEKSFSKDLKYHNIKMRYRSNKNEWIPIEIQIKSRFLFDYANLEHKLIYKNNDVSLMKNANYEIMRLITPSIVTLENIVDTVEGSLEQSEGEVLDYTRKKVVEKKLKEKYLDKYRLIASFIDDIDFIIVSGYKAWGKMRKDDIDISGLDDEVGFETYLNLITEERAFPIIQLSGDTSFLLKIISDFIKNQVEITKNILCHEKLSKINYTASIYEVDFIKETVEEYMELFKEKHIKKLNIPGKILTYSHKNKKYENSTCDILEKAIEKTQEIFENLEEPVIEKRQEFLSGLLTAIVGKEKYDNVERILMEIDLEDEICGVMEMIESARKENENED